MPDRAKDATKISETCFGGLLQRFGLGGQSGANCRAFRRGQDLLQRWVTYTERGGCGSMAYCRACNEVLETRRGISALRERCRGSKRPGQSCFKR